MWIPGASIKLHLSDGCYLNKVTSSICLTFMEGIEDKTYIKWKANCSTVGLNLEFKNIQNFEFMS